MQNLNAQLILGIKHTLSLLDRDFASSTCGSFDKEYWHYKSREFPNAMMQNHLLTLSYFYDLIKNNKDESNTRYLSLLIDDSLLKKYIIRSINYIGCIQHKDGSVDEHYYNEKSVVAAAFSLISILKSLEILKKNGGEDSFLKNIKNSTNRALSNQIYWLIKNPEKANISNHKTGVILSYLLSLRLLKEVISNKLQMKVIHALEKEITILLSRQKDEGWFPEYNGLDYGYLTLTLDHLTQIYLELKKNYFIPEEKNQLLTEEIRKSIVKLIKFLKKSYINRIIFPLGTIGSRNNFHLFISGFITINNNPSIVNNKYLEFIEKIIEEYFYYLIEEPHNIEHILDDKFSFFQLSDILANLKENTLLFNIISEDRVKQRKKEFNRTKLNKSLELTDFPQAKILIIREPNKTMVLNYGKGINILNINSLDIHKKSLWYDNGYLISVKGGKKYQCSFLSNITSNIEQKQIQDGLEGFSITIEGYLNHYQKKRITPLKKIILNILGLTFLRIKWINKIIKQILINKSITKYPKIIKNTNKSIKILRNIKISAGEPYKIIDKLIIPSKISSHIRKIEMCKGINPIFIPSGQNYYDGEYNVNKDITENFKRKEETGSQDILYISESTI